MEYQKLVWLAWYAYSQKNLAQMNECLERSLDCSPLPRIDTVLHWIQSFAELSTSKSEEFTYHSLTVTKEWQNAVASLALKNNQPNPVNLIAFGESEKILPNNFQDSITQHKVRRKEQKYSRIIDSFSPDFQQKERILCSLFQMSEAEIIEALLTIECKVREKDILAIVITDFTKIKLFDKKQIIVEYFPLSDRRINSLSDSMWHKYFSNRIASLFYEWNPQTILDLKNSVQKNLLVTL